MPSPVVSRLCSVREDEIREAPPRDSDACYQCGAQHKSADRTRPNDRRTEDCQYTGDDQSGIDEGIMDTLLRRNRTRVKKESYQHRYSREDKTCSLHAPPGCFSVPEYYSPRAGIPRAGEGSSDAESGRSSISTWV